MAFIVVYDANALYGNTLRDLLIRIGRAGLVQAKWTEDILNVLDQISIDDRTVFACVQAIADSRDRPPETIDDVLGQLERAGLVESAAALRTN